MSNIEGSGALRQLALITRWSLFLPLMGCGNGVIACAGGHGAGRGRELQSASCGCFSVASRERRPSVIRSGD